MTTLQTILLVLGLWVAGIALVWAFFAGAKKVNKHFDDWWNS